MVIARADFSDMWAGARDELMTHYLDSEDLQALSQVNSTLHKDIDELKQNINPLIDRTIKLIEQSTLTGAERVILDDIKTRLQQAQSQDTTLSLNEIRVKGICQLREGENHLLICKLATENQAELLKNLFMFGLEPKDSSGYTPLHRAVMEKNIELATALINNKVCINTPDRFKQRALHYAASHGLHSLVELLIQKGANPHLTNYYRARPYEFAKNESMRWRLLKAEHNHARVGFKESAVRDIRGLTTKATSTLQSIGRIFQPVISAVKPILGQLADYDPITDTTVYADGRDI